MSLVRRYPLISPFVLTYVFAWILWLPLVVLRDTIAVPSRLDLDHPRASSPIFASDRAYSDSLGQGFSTQAAWPAPDLSCQSPLVSGADTSTCRHRRGHDCLEYLCGRRCHKCRCDTA